MLCCIRLSRHMESPYLPEVVLSQTLTSGRGLPVLITCNLKTVIISMVMAIALMVCSCDEKHYTGPLKVIDVESALQDPHPIPVSRFSDSIHYIYLPSADSNFLVALAMFSFRNNQMLVSDYRSCLKFTERGEFLGRIGSKGRGPEEFLTMLSIDIGSDGTTYLHDIRKLLEFSQINTFRAKWDFLKEIPEDTSPGRVKLIYDSLFFVHIRNDHGDQQYKAFIVNKNGTIKESFNNFQFLHPLRKNGVSHIAYVQRQMSIKWEINSVISQFLMIHYSTLTTVLNLRLNTVFIMENTG